jgi:hypothetical protein
MSGRLAHNGVFKLFHYPFIAQAFDGIFNTVMEARL